MQKESSLISEKRDVLFGPFGLADVNKDGVISEAERFEACQRMGLEDDVIFPRLTLEDLARGIEAYKEH